MIADGYQLFDTDEFLARVMCLPWIEAEEQLVLRKEHGAMEVAVLNQELMRLRENGFMKGSKAREEVGRALQVVAADNMRINAALKTVHERLDALHWSKAVKAVFGDEGYEQCRIWMVQTDTKLTDAERQHHFDRLQRRQTKRENRAAGTDVSGA